MYFRITALGYAARCLLMWSAAALGHAAAPFVGETEVEPRQPYTEVEFSLTEGTWMSVDVSPDGNTLVFDLLGDIYRMPASGGEATLIHGGTAIDRLPTFSPDGKQIAYISDAGGSDNLWVSGLDGINTRQVSQETTAMMAGPAWDPQGKYLAATRFSSLFTKMRTSEIRLYHLQGGAGTELVSAPHNQRDVQEAEFSPRGDALFYTERVSEANIFVDANHSNFAIKRRDLNTGNTETLLQGFGGATTAEVSPDGRQVAFVRRVKDKTVLFVHDTQTGRQRPVYDDLDRDLQADYLPQGTYYPQYGWFPDNRHVAIWGKGQLYKIDMKTGAAQVIPFRATSRQRITAALRFGSDLAPPHFTVKAIRNISVDPAGKQMVFNALGRLWQKALPDGTPQRLSRSTAFEFEPVYSADGKHLVYVEWDDERGSVLKLRSPRGKVKEIVKSAGIIRQPSFSRDGKKLVYWIEPGNKDMGGYRSRPGIYWVSVAGGSPHFVQKTGEKPQFSPDGRRIYYRYLTTGSNASFYTDQPMISRLESVDLHGLDRQDHIIGPNISELSLSPDGNWVAFKEQGQYYVVPYRETGAPFQLTADDKAVPVKLLTEEGGFELTWSADSSAVHWLLGESYFSAPIAPQRLSEAPPPVYATIGLQAASDLPKGSLALTNARLITMEGEQVIEQGTVIVTENRIAALGAADEVAVPKSATVIDLTGKTIMPGLVNMHGHIDCCSSDGLMPNKQPRRFASLAFGITTNFDPYSSELPSHAAREMIQAGVSLGPRSISTGRGLYGRELVPDFSYVPIRGYEDALRIMRQKKALGASIVKSYKQPTRLQRQQLIKAARETGLMVAAEGESHFYNNLGMILDGHTTLEHNLPVAHYYQDIIQLFAHSNTANTPTLVVCFGEIMGENYLYQTTRPWDNPKIKAYVQQSESGYSPVGSPHAAPTHVRGMTALHAADELYEIGFRAVAKSTKRLDDRGVVVNAGSHGQIPGLGMHWEMWLMKQGGMSHLRVLRAATLNGARTLGLDRQIGSLKAGKLADLIVLDRNPLEDIHNTNSVRYTMINGRLYDSLSLNEIGNYDRKRGKFYWELHGNNGIDWNESWAH